MTPTDKTRMLAELLKGVPQDTEAYRALESLCLSELNRIEPIFNDILERELKTCVAILAAVMTPAQRKDIACRLKERAAESLSN